MAPKLSFPPLITHDCNPHPSIIVIILIMVIIRVMIVVIVIIVIAISNIGIKRPGKRTPSFVWMRGTLTMHKLKVWLKISDSNHSRKSFQNSLERSPLREINPPQLLILNLHTVASCNVVGVSNMGRGFNFRGGYHGHVSYMSTGQGLQQVTIWDYKPNIHLRSLKPYTVHFRGN